MKPLVAVFVVVLVLAIASTGFCQWEEFGVFSNSVTARWIGVGGTGTAAATDEGALDFNPASLATLKLGPGTAGNDMAWKGSITLGGGTFDESSLKVATVNTSQNWGAAVSFERASDDWTDELAQAGYGWKLSRYPLSLGASIASEDGDNYFNVGALYEVNQKTLPPVRLGAVVANVTCNDDEPAWLNLGVCVPVSERFFIALDGFDVTGSLWEPIYAFGAEYAFPKDLVIRAGSLDGAMTIGAGMKRNQWNLDVSFNGWPSDWGWSDEHQFTATAGVEF